MTIDFTLNVLLLIIGIIVGITAALGLLFNKTNREANKYLAALVTICVGALVHNFLIASGIYNQKPQLYFVPVLLSFGIGPLLYLFINRLIFLQPIRRKAVVLHLLPVLAQFIFYTVCFFQNSDTKYEIYARYYETYIKPIQILVTYASIAFYIYKSFVEIHFYKQQLNNFYSNSEKIALQWLQKLLYVFVFYYVVAILFVIVSYSFNISENYFPSDLIRCIIIFTIAAYAFNQTTLNVIQRNIHTVAHDDPQLMDYSTPDNIVSANNTEKTVAEIITEKPKEVNSDLLKKILETVGSEQLYLNEELTIADLAKKLGYSTKTVSYTINNGLKKSFSIFINEYRVNLFKEKKSSGNYNHLSIMGLAYDCGFNSKSSFNRIYKEITGSSPKEQKSVGE